MEHGRDESKSYNYWLVPDYLNDLNAMHEAEKTLTGKECEQYQAELDALSSEERFLRVELDHPAEEYFFHATAQQRATAFLRAVRKGGA